MNTQPHIDYQTTFTNKFKYMHFPNKKDVKTGLKIYFKSMLIFWLACAVIKIVTLTGAIYYNGYTFSDFANNKNGVLEISARLLSGMPVNSTNYYDNLVPLDEFDLNTNSNYNTHICGSHGECMYDTYNSTNDMCECECDNCYVNTDGKTCNYHQSLQLTAFLLSFLIGECGADWFYLARGNCCYVCGGVGKLLTFGGIMIWWLVDWIRLLVGTFPDGNHHGLCGFDDM